MEGKNVLMAIVLSTVVLVFWATFFEAPVIEQRVATNNAIENENISTPTIDEVKNLKKVSRQESIKNVSRVKLENNNIIGSISLEGGIIDDVTFKKYRKTLESDEKVIFLNPKSYEEGYYIETGWASAGNKKLNLPLDNTVWKIKGNNLLSPNKPIILET